MRPTPAVGIGGYVAPGFEQVREAFVDGFVHRRELGGACCVVRDGRAVVDLWGGLRDAATGAPWREDTMVIVYSATKGLAAMVMALAHSRGWLDYDERVATYWPAFAQHGKEAVTVRQLLAHQAGLFALDVPIDRALVADPDRLAAALARQAPAWPPGERQAYHAITLGFHEGELIRRVDPLHRTLGRVFHDEIAAPLGLEAYVRLPDSIPDDRLARITRPSLLAMLRGFPPRFLLAAFDRRSNISRALDGSMLAHDDARIYARDFEVPSGGGVCTARGIARAYGEFASGGRTLGLRAATLDALAAPAQGLHDECLMADGVTFSLGFMKHCPVWPFGGPAAYGSPGAGGALGFADPEAGIGYAYVTCRMGTSLTGDPREVALREATYDALRRAG